MIYSKFHLWDKIRCLGLGKASSQTANLVPSVEFPYPALVIMMDSINNLTGIKKQAVSKRPLSLKVQGKLYV
jgi:hypothetical protein